MSYNYLQCKPASRIYHFRISIPLHLRAVLGKREICKSLHTREPRLARVRAAPFIDAATILFSGLQGVEPMPLTKILDVLGLKKVNDIDDRLVKIRHGGNTLEVEIDTHGAKTIEEELAIADEYLKKNQHTLTPIVQPAKPVITGKRLSEMLVLYKQRNKDVWKPKTKMVYRGQFDTMINLLGDPVARSITRTDASDFVILLSMLPVNAYKGKEYEELTAREIIELQQNAKTKRQTISPQTVNDYLDRLCGFMDYIISNGQADINPFRGLKLPEPPLSKTKRRAFKKEELIKIFTTSNYLHKQYEKPWQYWLPILGLYTGARLNELCGMTVSDVSVIDGIPCIAIQNREDEDEEDFDFSTKTEKSQRQLPLHIKLIELGFLDFVESRRIENKNLLFDLVPKMGSYIRAPSEWFSDLKKSVGITDSKAVFHSFRHSLQVQLQLTTKVSAELRSAYMGHSTAKGAIADGGSATTIEHYGIIYPPNILAEAVLPYLDFGFLDLKPYKPV